MRRSAGHGDCTIGKDTQGNIYRRRSRRGRCARINISAACTRAAEASCRGRSLPLSPRLRLTLRRVVSEATALPRPPSSLVERRRPRAGRAASSPGGASSGGAWPRMGITDPRGDIAGDPAAGYGRFRFHPNIIPRIIISASANSVRTAPPRRGAKNEAARLVLTSRAAMLMSEGKKLQEPFLSPYLSYSKLILPLQKQ